jgi:PAS domain S-box-containing protein
MSGAKFGGTRGEAGAESTRLIAERVRLGLWLTLLGSSLFAVTDLRFELERVFQLYTLKLSHLPFILASFLLLRRYPTRSWAMTVAVSQVALICLLTALSSYIAEEQITGPILVIFVVYAAALIVPWGPRLQLLAVLSAAASLLLHLYLMSGTLRGIFNHDSAVVTVALGATLLVAWVLERQRRAQFERDVERRQAAAALAHAEERKSAILAAALDAIITIDREGRLVEMNPAAERMFGYAREQVLGQDIAEYFIPPASRAAHRRGIVDVLDGRVSRMLGRRVEVTAMRADGSEFPAELAVSAVGAGERLTFTGHVRDLTEQRRAATEQRRLVEILEATTDLVGTTDTEGRVLYYNAAGREMLGIGADEDLTGRRSSDNIPARSWQRIANGSVAAALAGHAWRGEGEIAARDGRVVPVSQVIIAHRDADGRIEGFSTIARDISEQKRAEEALQEEAAVSGTTARLGQELIAALDSPGLSQRLCELTAAALGADVSHTFLWQEKRHGYVPMAHFGEDGDSWEGLRVLALPTRAAPGVLARLESDDAVQLALRPLDAASLGADEIAPEEARVSEQICALAAQGGLTRGVYIALRKGGKLIGFQDASFRGRRDPVSRAQMRVARAIGQMASLVIEHAQLVDALERANRLKSEFVATMSHELRTPLNVIMGYNALLRDGDYGAVSDEQREVMRRIDRSSQELLELINATLDMSRLDAGRVPLEVREIEGADLLREIEADARHVKLRPGVSLRWVVDGSLPRLRTDPGKIKVVLKNLIGNAAKFTEEGHITLRSQTRGGELEFEVSDTGVGIPGESLPIIFEAFRQVDGSSTRRHGGVGLGLYIVRRLVDMLGGTVHVESTLGVGSTFRVRLPAAGTLASDAPAPPFDAAMAPEDGQLLFMRRAARG